MSLIEQIAAAGVVGCGGAGFPTHVKLKGTISHYIVNAVECEPLLRTDRYILVHLAQQVVQAASAVRRELGNIPCTIAIKADYREEIASLNAAIAAVDPEIRLHKLSSFYPAGDEQSLVAEVSGKTVPPAGIPLDVGCAVNNAATMLCVFDAMNGMPFTHKYLTVNGAVAHPVVLKVPVGTSFAECIARAGGALIEDFFVVSGGPMMGKRMERAEALESCVTKTTSGILVLPNDGPIATASRIAVAHMKNRARAACIQCRQCTDMCPRYLLGHPLQPHMVMRKLAFAQDLQTLYDDPDVRQALLCCECGICELYACPMQLQPRRINAMIKEELSAQGIRWPKGEGQQERSELYEFRKVPSRRAAARAGVLPWYDACGTAELLELEAQTVTILLKQGAGAPASPVVRCGERVEQGQLIARCPEGSLGANLHASIPGTAQVDRDRIVIQREGGRP